MRSVESPARRDERPIDDAFVSLHAMQICNDVLEHPLPCRSQVLSRRALARSLAYIAENIGSHITLAGMAESAHTSRFHFARLFRETLGCSPMRYVEIQRVNIAKALLASGIRDLSALATSLGFFDQSHFTRVFKKTTGTTPGRYLRHLESMRRLEQP